MDYLMSVKGATWGGDECFGVRDRKRIYKILDFMLSP